MPVWKLRRGLLHNIGGWLTIDDRDIFEESPRQYACKDCAPPPSIERFQVEDGPWNGLHLQDGNGKDPKSQYIAHRARIGTLKDILGSLRL